jgi:uncharacterized protein YjbI with pentapeptide repeats
MSGVTLSFARLTGGDLSGQNLAKIRMRYASLLSVKLPGVNLTEATLIGTLFTKCDLQAAQLRGAKLSGAVFIDERWTKLLRRPTTAIHLSSLFQIMGLFQFHFAGNRDRIKRFVT